MKNCLKWNIAKGLFNMDVWRCVFTMLFVLECRCQYQTVNNQLEVPEYEAKPLYDLYLDVKPISTQVIKDTRHAEGTYDFVYISSSSEIRLIPNLIFKINYEKEMLMQTRIVTNGYLIPFPNRVEALPLGTIDAQPGYVWYITSGDMGRSSNTGGGIHLIDLTRELWQPVPIIKDSSAQYTHVFWGDMDVDGRKDCVTIRETSQAAQLVWLKHPEGNTQWTDVHPISNTTRGVGGSVFKVLRLKKGESKVQNLIFVAGKTTAELTVFWTEDPDNDWTQLDSIQSFKIGTGQQYVDVDTVDLNGDGVPDILATVSALAGKPGKLIAYELPKTRRYGTGKWREHVLAEWPSSTTATFKSISPSHAITFKVGSTQRTRQKKHILISGGSDKKVYVLVPISWSHVIWRYTKLTIFEGTTTVGRPEVKDVDGDGTPEIFIPTGNQIYVMRYDLSSSVSKPAVLKISILILLFLIFITTYYV